MSSADVVADVAQHLLARTIGGCGHAADDRRPDDQAVGHRGQQPDVFGSADAEPDADGQVGLFAELCHVVDDFRRQ